MRKNRCGMVRYVANGSFPLLGDGTTEPGLYLGVDTRGWPDVKGIAAELKERKQINFE